MLKPYQKFYWVNGKIFENTNNRLNGKGKAIKYCKDIGLEHYNIYELANSSEIKRLEELLQYGNITDLKSHEQLTLINEFENANGEVIPPLKIELSFTYLNTSTNYKHYVVVLGGLYEITKEFVLLKKLFDYYHREHAYLEVYYLDEAGKWQDWTIASRELFIKQKQENHKKKLNQLKMVRQQQKFDRLMKLRSEGKITEAQLKELYRLEKVYRG